MIPTETTEASPPRDDRHRHVLSRYGFWVIALLGGLGLRVALLPLAPLYGYAWDHDDMVRWGIQAADHGLLTLYDVPAPRHNLRVWQDGEWVVMQRTLDRLFSYPPLLVYPTYAAGKVHKWLSPERLINTVTSRAVFGAVSILSDILLAGGCAALARLLGSATAGRWAFALLLFAPPIWWDSSLWGQVDSVVLAPLVWMLWAMCSGRWHAAGVLFGAALMLKPQAIVFLPLWLLTLLTVRPPWRPLLALVVAALTITVVSLPFTWHGGLTWWRVSYVANLTSHPATTLKAFNLWYADALLHETLDVNRRWWDLSMDAWGRALLSVALIAGFFGIVKRWGRRPDGLVVWSAIATLLGVMLPTRVHERYLLMALPFLIVAATLRRRLVVGFVALLIVATAQLTSTLWLHTDPGDWEKFVASARVQHEQTLATLPPAQRLQMPGFDQRIAPARQQYLAARAKTAPIEWTLVALALGGTVAFIGAALWNDERGKQTGAAGSGGAIFRANEATRARERATRRRRAPSPEPGGVRVR